MGFILTATSASISVMNLISLGKLWSVEGNTIANAAVIDDIIGILLLSIVAGITTENYFDFKSLIFVTLLNLSYFILIFLVSAFFIPFLLNHISKLKNDIIYYIISLFFILMFSFYAGEINIFTITGIYFSGLFISKTELRATLEETLKIGQIIFVSIFFIFIGLGLNLRIINFHILYYVLAFLFVAFIGKIIGCGGVAKIVGFDFKRSFRIGCGMSPRGEIALVITSIAFFTTRTLR